MQSAESMDFQSTIARNFTMVDGGVTAYASDSSIVGVSEQVPKEDGWLLFSRPENGTTVSPAKVYCKLVSSKKLGFSLTGFDCVASELVQHKPSWSQVSVCTSGERR
jgi:hypothetical protein